MTNLLKSILPRAILRSGKNIIFSFKVFINKLIHKGNNVYCPICDTSFDQFGIYGLKKRKNAQCYSCGSLERHRLIYMFIDKNLKLFENRDKPLRLLHFAPERFFYKLFSNYEMIEYTPCDLFPEIYDYGGKIKVKKVDITQIPFDDQSFDLILCNHVLEHIPDDLRAMSELYRVLSNNGQGIFQVPLDYSKNHTYEDFKITDPKERKIAFGQHDHVRIYGKDYKDSLEKVGFNVEVNDFINQFTKAEKFKYGILKSELIYYCGKH